MTTMTTDVGRQLKNHSAARTARIEETYRKFVWRLADGDKLSAIEAEKLLECTQRLGLPENQPAKDVEVFREVRRVEETIGDETTGLAVLDSLQAESKKLETEHLAAVEAERAARNKWRQSLWRRQTTGEDYARAMHSKRSNPRVFE